MSEVIDATNLSSTEVDIQHFDGSRRSDRTDHVAREEPLEIRVEGKSVAVVMRTPGHDRELASGFLLSEGVIREPCDIFEISECPSRSDAPEEEGNVIDVLLAKGTELDLDQLTRHVFSSSSCGICGKATIDSVFVSFPKIETGKSPSISSGALATYPERLRSAQPTFEKTGGLHASVIFDDGGEIVVVREDVGRHNALDKVIGHALLEEKLPLDRHVLLLSGRISFELMQKALSAGIAVVAGISAPSGLAIEFARRSGQTLVGFLRGETMNVYAGCL